MNESGSWTVERSEVAVGGESCPMIDGRLPGLALTLGKLGGALAACEFLPVTLEQAVALGSFLVKCVPDTSYLARIRMHGGPDGSGGFRFDVGDVGVDLIAEGGSCDIIPNGLWLSACSARELGRVMLTMAMPDVCQVSRPAPVAVEV